MDDLAFVAPLTVHIDGGPCTKTRSVNVLSFGGLHAQGDEKVTKSPCASYLKGDRPDTNIWDFLLRDFEALATGLVGGRPVATGRDGRVLKWLLLFVKSDEEVRSQEFGFANPGAADEVCSECLGNRTSRPFTDLRATAAWRRSESLPFVAYAARARQPPHPLTEHPFFCFRFFFYLDLMHLMDCKGVLALAFGSVCKELIADPRLGANQQERLDTINERRKALFDSRPGSVRLPKLLLANLTKDGWGDLHGKTIKAAITRHALPFFVSLVTEFYNRGTPEDTDRVRMLGALDELYNVVYNEPMFLPPDAQRRLREACLTFGACYQRLREAARLAGRCNYRVTPKVHKMQHLPLMGGFINPRCVQNYAEESLIGTATKTYKASMNGRHMGVAQVNFLAKRMVALLLRFEIPQRPPRR